MGDHVSPDGLWRWNGQRWVPREVEERRADPRAAEQRAAQRESIKPWPITWASLAGLWVLCITLDVFVHTSLVGLAVLATVVVGIVWLVQVQQRSNQRKREMAQEAAQEQLRRENETGVAVRTYATPAAYQIDAPNWMAHGWYPAEQSTSVTTTGNSRRGYTQHVSPMITYRRNAPEQVHLTLEQAPPKMTSCQWCHTSFQVGIPSCPKCGAPAATA